MSWRSNGPRRPERGRSRRRGVLTDGGTDEPAGQAIDGAELIDRLEGASIVTDDGADLRLTDEFAEVWQRRARRVRAGDRTVDHAAMILEVDPADLTVEERDGEYVARLAGRELGEWPSEAALLADLALYPTLAEWLPVWESLDGRSRGTLLARLRAFLEVCPACDGSLVAEERAGGEGTEVSLVCEGCGQVSFSGSY